MNSSYNKVIGTNQKKNHKNIQKNNQNRGNQNEYEGKVSKC